MTDVYYNCGIKIFEETLMPTSSIRISSELLDQARLAARAEFRTVQGQLEYWAMVGRAALDNPDLPVDFVADAIMGMSEPRSELKPFVFEK